MKRRQFIARSGSVAVASLTAARRTFAADAYPAQPINIIVPYAPGGGIDTTARLMAAALGPELNTSVEIINRPGAASQVGMTELVRAKPDGYTLAYAVLPTVVTHYLDPRRGAVYTRASFQKIATHHMAPMMLAVRSDSPYHSLRDLVEATRKSQGGIKISDSGLLGTPHVCALMVGLAAGVKFASVHFNGGAPSVTALLGGHVDALAGATSDARAYQQAGSFRVLGVASAEPDPSMPDVPTMKSQGFDVVVASVPGMVAPAGTPAPIITTLTNAARKIIDSPEHQKKLIEYGVIPHYLDPNGFEQLWADTEVRMKPLLEQVRSQQ